jgi:hypothetical protein
MRQPPPLMQSIGDYMALLETSYGTSEAAKYLKVDAEWFLSPNPDLETVGQEKPLSPRDWLLRRPGWRCGCPGAGL